MTMSLHDAMHILGEAADGFGDDDEGNIAWDVVNDELARRRDTTIAKCARKLVAYWGGNEENMQFMIEWLSK